MPTGYTSSVQDGKITEFKDFALLCARAMGACIMQRDDPMDDKPKLEKPSTFYSKSIKETEEALEKLKDTPLDKWKANEEKYIKNSLEDNQKRMEERKLQRARYDTMLKKVEAYSPPTPEHEGFKSFMIEQLKESIKFDCGGDYYERTIEELKEGFAKLGDERYLQSLKDEKIASLQRDLEYYTKQHEEDVERTNSRNEWIKQLYKSLE